MARAALSVDWEPELVAAVLTEQLTAPHLWLRGLVERMFVEFPSERLPPRYEALHRFLREDPVFDPAHRRAMARRVGGKGWAKPPSIERTVFDRPGFRSGGLAGDQVPSISSPSELALWLELEAPQLEAMADIGGWLGRQGDSPLQHYHRRRIGPPERPRFIEAPKPQLKAAQRRIYDGILKHLPVHPAAHGFVPGRSIRTHAEAHADQAVVLRFDLRRFFPSIEYPRVRGLFRAMGYPEAVTERLAGLTTTLTPTEVLGRMNLDREARKQLRIRHLPQGAPTSPGLANGVARVLDLRLAGLSARFGATYSRYADDLTFSGSVDFDRRFERFQQWLQLIVRDEGFDLHPAKTRRMRKSGAQRVTGLAVNAHVALPRKELDRLRALFHRRLLSGWQGPQDRARLQGHLAYVSMVRPAQSAKLRQLFDAIELRWGASGTDGPIEA